MPTEMDFKEARAVLSRMNISLDGELPDLSLMVMSRKMGWQEPNLCELGRVRQEGSSFTVYVLNLPYFCGPRWKELTGGKPFAIECKSADELVDFLQRSLLPRMTAPAHGVLEVERDY